MAELFSIIMPAFNAEKTICESIDSVLSQSESRWKLYIVNDCSNDSTKKKVLEYQDPRIAYFENENNMGVANSRNKALSICTGDFITFLDSDDIWLPNKLERQLKFFKKGWSVVCSNYYTFHDDSSQVVNRRYSPEMIKYSDMLKSNFIGNLTGAYNAKVLGTFYQKNIGHEDYIMWLEIIGKAKRGVCIQEELAAYRLSVGSISANKIKMITWQWNIYRKYLKLPFFKALYYMVNYIHYALKKRM